ncbi:HNH endonuclease [Hyphomicrobium sp. DY-1]|uniref:HNH endonuclease n=1 Tax=Hyphomicrobium sp. DY-1 TaxID=3075650 RepID=UPI0039C08BAF
MDGRVILVLPGTKANTHADRPLEAPRINHPTRHDSLRRAQLFQEQEGLCFYCREPMMPKPFLRPIAPRALTLEHLTPLSEGGSRRFPNEVAACNHCNNQRGTTSWLLFYCLKELERDESGSAAA